MSNPSICYSLRKRPDWAALTPALLRGNGVQWKEAKLDTHDVALPLPESRTKPQRVLRAILLSPSDVGTDESRRRIQRLSHLNGGQDVVIVFLLKQGQDQGSSTAALMTLQLDLSEEFRMPIIPVHSVQAVSTNLMSFQRQICTNNGPRRIANPAQALLPFCSDRQLLSEHAVNVLTDITTDVRDLLEMASTQSGQTRMVEYLGSDSERAISFWAEEYLVD
ncbi:hypothetical protein GGS26DRAFT_586437 [Hypomontagnella submonticulosa]|nr:hypothetical protein GGS26DRAFT_586437 [Hypomontagnella submonticulosa]